MEEENEDDFAIKDSNHRFNDKDLAGLPVDRVENRVSRLHLNSASSTQTVVDDKRPVGKEMLTVPGVEEGGDNGEIEPNVKPETRNPRSKNTMCNPPSTGCPREPQVKLDRSCEKMFPAFIIKLSN